MSWRAKLALGATILALAAALAPWTVPGDLLASGLTQHLAESYGLRLTVAGRASVALLPVPRVKFARAALATQEGAMLLHDVQLRGELALAPLLVGRVELKEATIVGGTVRLARDAAGASSWTAPIAIALSPKPRETSSQLRRIIVQHATIAVGGPGRPPEIRDVSAVIAWPAASSALDITGSFAWRGETVELRLALPDPQALASGRAAAVEATLSGRPGRITASGSVELSGDPRFAGRADASLPSLRGAASWLGLSLPAELDRTLSLSGELRADAARIDAGRLFGGLGREDVEGALSVAFGAAPFIQATLAAGPLDLDWLRRALEPPLTAWSEAGAPLPFPASNLDLRLSASRVRVGGMTLEDGAASLIVTGGRLEATLLRATIDGGAVKGKLVASLADERRAIRAQASVEGVEARPLLASLGLPATLAGKATGHVTLDSAAGPGASLLRALSGRATMSLAKGQVSGLDVATALRRPDVTGLGGRTEFDRAQLSIRIADGVAEIADGTFEDGTLRTSLEGRVSLPGRFVSLRALAAPPAGPGIVLDVNGPWAKPSIVSGPIPGETARRSGTP